MWQSLDVKSRNKNQIPTIEAKVTEKIKKLIMQGTTQFMAGGAIGFDTMVAQSVLDLKSNYTEIKLILAIPCLQGYKNSKE